MKTIYLIRHAEKKKSDSYSSIANLTLDITEEGKIQAEKTALFLESSQPNKLISSSLTRALATARIIGTKLKLEPEIDDHFKERIFLTNDVSSEYSLEEFKRSQQDWFYAPPNGESLMEVVYRFDNGLKNLLDRLEKGQSAVVVTHGRALQSYLNIRNTNSLLNVFDLQIKYCSISTLVFDSKNILIDSELNTTSHLD